MHPQEANIVVGYQEKKKSQKDKYGYSVGVVLENLVALHGLETFGICWYILFWISWAYQVLASVKGPLWGRGAEYIVILFEHFLFFVRLFFAVAILIRRRFLFLLHQRTSS